MELVGVSYDGFVGLGETRRLASAAVLYGFLRVHAPQTASFWHIEAFLACQYSSGARPYSMRNAPETSAPSGGFHEFSVRYATGGGKRK